TTRAFDGVNAAQTSAAKPAAISTRTVTHAKRREREFTAVFSVIAAPSPPTRLHDGRRRNRVAAVVRRDGCSTSANTSERRQQAQCTAPQWHRSVTRRRAHFAHPRRSTGCGHRDAHRAPVAYALPVDRFVGPSVASVLCRSRSTPNECDQTVAPGETPRSVASGRAGEHAMGNRSAGTG